MHRRLLYVLLFLSSIVTIILYQIDRSVPGKSVQKVKYDLNTSAGLQAYFFEQKKIAKTKPKSDKPDQAFEEMIALRTEIGKDYAYKDNWRFKAYQQAVNGSLSLRKAAALNWIERGPSNIGGRSRSIVVHPADSTIWWVGAVGGGVWKTTDGGTTWQSMTDNMPILSVCALDICRVNPDILYAGTGEGFYNSDGIIGDGIFKTTDGGTTWNQLASTASNSAFRYVNRIIVDPDDPDVVLAATNTGVYRSSDGGSNWSTVYQDAPTTRVQQIIANPLNFNTQFIAVNQEDNAATPGGIYKSVDSGLNWARVSDEIPTHARIEMAIAPTDTNIVYATVESGYAVLGLYRSADAGQTWKDYGGSSTNWLGSQGWYDNAITVSPLSANTVFLGGIDIYRADIVDTTATYTKLTNWYSGIGYPYVHADQHFLKTIKTSGSAFTIITANDGGIHASYNNGVSWAELNNGYNVTQYYDADMSPADYEFIAGSQDNGTHHSPTQPDASTAWTQVIGGDGFDCVWDKTNPQIVYGTLYNTRIYQSLDGGVNFTGINNNMPESNFFHTPLAMDPVNSSKLFTLGFDNKIWYTSNAGSSWDSVSLAMYSSSRGKVTVSLANSNIVWAGNTSRYLNVSTDGGAHFSEVADNPDIHAYLTGLATHPVKDSTAYMTLGVSGYGKVYRTRDLGQTWENINNNLPDVPALCLLVMPFDTSEIWLGTDIGLFVSTDNGQSWSFQNEGLPAVAIYRLKIVGQNIVAATHGRGVWSVYRQELSSGPLLAPVLDDILVPNPNTGVLKLGFFSSADYDSVQMVINNVVIERFYNLPAAQDTFALYSTSPPELITAMAIGYYNGDSAQSAQKSRSILNSEALLSENFDDGTSDFFGDFTISTPTGFTDPLLNSEHDYSDGKNHIAYLGTPIEVLTGSTISYNDVAIVEPGEIGTSYPDEAFWDYVTLEGSSDGENWDLLISPYDCNYNGTWRTTYDNNLSGNESMIQPHLIELTSYYAIGTNVYLRYRLFADAYTHGWGWAIDDLDISNSVSDIAAEKQALHQFALLGNYPNPFNPSTRINFTLDKTRPVSLKVYNTLGQLVKTIYSSRVLETGTMHQARWDGTNDAGQSVASGMYLYRLQAGHHASVKRMLLIR